MATRKRKSGVSDVGRSHSLVDPSAASTAQRRALDAVRWMRKGKSLTHAAKLAHTSPRTVHKYADNALGTMVRGTYRPTRSDRLVRELRFLTPDGLVAVRTRSARAASEIARYFSAVDKALRTGNTRPLAPFVGRTIQHGRKKLRYVTDIHTLTRLAHVGEVRFEDLYVSSA